MEIDPVNNNLKCINCGHNPPLIKREKDIIALNVSTPVLGVLSDYKPEEQTIPLYSNDILFAYTDGLSELNNPKGEQLGMEPIKEILNTHQSKPMTI